MVALSELPPDDNICRQLKWVPFSPNRLISAADSQLVETMYHTGQYKAFSKRLLNAKKDSVSVSLRDENTVFMAWSWNDQPPRVASDAHGHTVPLAKGDNQGYLYYHFRPERSYIDVNDGNKKKGLVLFGGPDVIPSAKNIESKVNESIMRTMIKEVTKSFPALTGVPPSRYWTGTMGFTSDLIPIVDSIHAGRVVLAVAFNGFGGTFCVLAGKLAATLAVDGRTSEVEQFAPKDMFGVSRFKD